MFSVIIYHYPSDCVLSTECEDIGKALIVAAYALKFFNAYVLNNEKSTDRKWVYEYAFGLEVGHVEVKERVDPS